MTNQIIDKRTGDVLIDGQKISFLSSFSEIFSLIGDRIKLENQHAGWSEYKIEAIKLGDDMLTARLSFNQRVLEIIELYIQFDNLPKPIDWDEWTEEFESKKKDTLNNWLNIQIGKEREFDWGRIKVVLDKKSGYSSITISKI